MFTLVPTTRNGQALYYQEHLYNKLKPTDPITGVTIWSCKFYQDPDVKCKTLLNESMSKNIKLSMVFIFFEYELYFRNLVDSFKYTDSFEKKNYGCCNVGYFRQWV